MFDAPYSMMVYVDPETSQELFGWLDEFERRHKRVSVEIVLSHDRELMTITTKPRPFTHVGIAYDVLLDHRPSGLWERYRSGEGASLYLDVPRLLVSDHIMSRGGIIAVHRPRGS